MFYIIRFLVSWVLWLLLADKKRWRELFPVCFFAGFVGSLVDNVIFEHRLWGFPGVSLFRTTVLDDLGLNVVFTYLFMQWLPRDRTFLKIVRHWFVWTAFAIAIEFVHLRTGHLEYHGGWNIGWSYLSDWILLTIFYLYYRIFQFSKLSRTHAQE